MTDPARNRFFVMGVARIAGVALAVFGVVLLGRAVSTGQSIAAIAIVLGGMGIMALVPRALAQRWRTPPE